MKISLIENGMDSLSKGYAYYLQYENIGNELDRYLCLKDAILSLHHGVEILFKSILYNESECLVFSTINNHVQAAFIEKRNKKLQSVFQTTLKDKIHTVTYIECIGRVETICGISLNKSLKNKLLEINNYRNLLIHSEAYINEEDIKNTLENFIDPLDHYFYNNFDDTYRTISGYEKLIKTYKDFEERIHEGTDSRLNHKKEVIKTLINALKNNKIVMGENKVKVIDDVNIIFNILTSFTKSGYLYGMDLYNLHSSGKTSLKRIDNNVFSLEATDTRTEYRFHLKSMLILVPKIDSSFSPIILLEASTLKIPKEYEKSVKEDFKGRNIISEIHINDTVIHIPEEVGQFYEKKEDDSNDFYPKYINVIKFVDPGIVAFLNIQGLHYPHQIFKTLRDLDMKTIEISLREALEKENQKT